MKRNILKLLLLTFFAAWLIPTESEAQWTKTRRDLTHHFQLEKIRVFYDTEGEHAVVQTDIDNNGVPDQVEDIAKQTLVASHLFVNTLGFPDPIKSKRYAGVAFIDINLLSKKTLGGGTYIGYDEVQSFNREIDDPQLNPDQADLNEPESIGPQVVRTISFDISTSVDPRISSSPTRGYFLLIKTGASYFKNTWYTRGSSRWAHYVIAKGGIGDLNYSPKAKWPHSAKNIERLFAMGFDAERLIWNPLAKLDDRKGEIPKEKVSDEIKNLKYSDGTPIIVDYKLTGAEIIRDILIELGKVDDVVYKELKYKSWKESNQRSAKNSPYIYEAIMNVARARGHEVGAFKASEYVFPEPKEEKKK